MQLFRAHVALMLVGLQADGPDGRACVQTVADQRRVFVAEVEIVDEQQRLRVGGLRGVKDFLHQADAAIALADAGDGVVIAVKFGHDDHFVDHVPDVDHPGEGGDIPVDALELLVEDRLVVVLHQPVGACRVPAQRMPLDPLAVFHQVAGGVHAAFKPGLALLGLIVAPVEGHGAVVEQPQPLLHAILKEGVALFFVGAGDGVEGAAAKPKVVLPLLEVQLRVGDGRALAVPDAKDGMRFAMLVGHGGYSSLVGR